jgi:arginyl-tRNA synthetase
MILQTLKKHVENVIFDVFSYSITIEYAKKGDAQLACPLFQLSKEKGLSPQEVFQQLEAPLNQIEGIASVSFERGFLNVYIHQQHFIYQTIEAIRHHLYLNDKKEKEVIVIDYSSPNIAKRFSVGHIRSTVIGAALRRLFRFLGDDVEGINHLGDWGTQFGKMIYAYLHYGYEGMLDDEPIAKLQELYVQFHDEEKVNPSLADDARKIFLELENGNPTYLELWQLFKDLSLKEFEYYYKLLNVDFDHVIGESFYESYMADAVKEMEDKGLLVLDDDAMIIPLGDDMPPALIKKKDGSTLYMTRDVAAAIYRHKHFKASTILYVVGNEQALHFKQLQRVLDQMGYKIRIEHVNFGLVLQDGKKMSTRKGGVHTLQAVFDEAIALSKQAIEEKNPQLEHKDQVAQSVAVGAIIFNDLKNEKHLNIEFNLSNMLKFEGQTGPYIQYTSVRMAALLRQLEPEVHEEVDITSDHAMALSMVLNQFEDTLIRARSSFQPSIIARYALNLSQTFNSWYGQQKMITDDIKTSQMMLSLVEASREILNQSMRLLGIDVLDYM